MASLFADSRTVILRSSIRQVLSSSIKQDFYLARSKPKGLSKKFGQVLFRALFKDLYPKSLLFSQLFHRTPFTAIDDLGLSKSAYLFVQIGVHVIKFLFQKTTISNHYDCRSASLRSFQSPLNRTARFIAFDSCQTFLVWPLWDGILESGC